MIRIENKGRSRWVFPIIEVVAGPNKTKRRAQTAAVVLEGNHGPSRKGRKDAKQGHILEMSDEDFAKLGPTNQAVINDLAEKAEIEIRRS